MQSLINDFNDMLNKGIMPLFEYELNNEEFLVVDISINDKGLCFDFDNELPTFFSGEIVEIEDGIYLMPFDECFSLDCHLQEIDQEIQVGYLLPNNLI